MLNPVLADARVFLEEKQNWQNEAQAGLCVSTPISRTELVHLGMNSDETQIHFQDVQNPSRSSDPHTGQTLITCYHIMVIIR